MNSDQFTPEPDFYPRRHNVHSPISGRAWVKRDLEFWHYCTVEVDDGTTVTVAFDNMDELTVDRENVHPFELEPGDLVFVQHWQGGIGGYPAVVIAAKGEVVEVEFPYSLYRSADRKMCFLRDLLFYDNLPPAKWQSGIRVFAYKAIQFRPALFLLFPALVRRIHFDVCVEVEFGDGETAFVPTTLVEKPELKEGDIVHTCTSYVSPDELWSPCHVLNRVGDKLLLQDGAGEQFSSPMSMIAVLPNGYSMVDGKFEKISNTSARGPRRSQREASGIGFVHVVHTDHWWNAAEEPVTKVQVDRIIEKDPELAWATEDWDKMSGDERIVTRTFSILWKGQACFSWDRNGIRSPNPNEEQLARMIEMAIELDANVIGDDDREYH